MDKVYANLIKHGLKTIDDVPSKLREAVEKILYPYSGMTKAELIEIAEEEGIEVKSSDTKADIIEKLEEEI